MVFTREKNGTSNKNGRQCFFTCEKNDTSNQKPQRCVSFAPKFPPFLDASSLQRIFVRRHSTRKVLLDEVEWIGFVCFIVDEENCEEPAKQQRKGKNRTRSKLKLCFLSELFCLQ